jgi:mono/diheme cytochrome c family protein
MPVQDHITKQVDQALAANSPATLMAARSVFRFNSVPAWLVYVVITMVVASWIPLAFAVQAKFTKSDKPRVHLFQGMDNQARLNAQATSPVFANEMAMRPPIPGTVARGQLDADDMYHRGFVFTGVADANGSRPIEWATDFPEPFQVTAESVARGKELWARYCYLCHGFDGYGNGPVHVTAASDRGKNPLWVQPSSMHDSLRRERPVGHIYNTVNIGIRNMAGYGHAIPDPGDRWAIVAYVRALQLSQHADPSLVPEGIEPVEQPTLVSAAAQLIVTGDEPEVELVESDDPNLPADPE